MSRVCPLIRTKPFKTTRALTARLLISWGGFGALGESRAQNPCTQPRQNRNCSKSTRGILQLAKGSPPCCHGEVRILHEQVKSERNKQRNRAVGQHRGTHRSVQFLDRHYNTRGYRVHFRGLLNLFPIVAAGQQGQEFVLLLSEATSNQTPFTRACSMWHESTPVLPTSLCRLHHGNIRPGSGRPFTARWRSPNAERTVQIKACASRQNDLRSNQVGQPN